jgi:hypothetical protein
MVTNQLVAVSLYYYYCLLSHLNIIVFSKNQVFQVIVLFGRCILNTLYNRELEELHNEPNIFNVIKSSRLRRVGHVVQKDENELPKKILWTNPGGQQGLG